MNCTEGKSGNRSPKRKRERAFTFTRWNPQGKGKKKPVSPFRREKDSPGQRPGKWEPQKEKGKRQQLLNAMFEEKREDFRTIPTREGVKKESPPGEKKKEGVLSPQFKEKEGGKLSLPLS